MRHQSSEERRTSPNKAEDAFSGVKRAHDSPITLFGDLPTPLPLSSSKKMFFKETPFPRPNSDEDISPPAQKMIKTENVTPSKVEVISCKVENSDSESDTGSSHHSSSSNSSPENVRHRYKGLHSGPNENRGASSPVNRNSPNLDIPQLFSIPTPETLPVRPFCYNCKRYGHVKRQCRSSWYHWWPQEYLFRYPWLRKRIREAAQLRWAGRFAEYRRFVKKIEEDVEEQDERKQHLFTQYRTQSNWNRPHYYGGVNFNARSRADGQKILHAIRRTSPPPLRTPCCPTQHTFSFDCQRLIGELQEQVKQLRFTLTEISSKSTSISPTSISPPATKSGLQSSHFHFSTYNRK